MDLVRGAAKRAATVAAAKASSGLGAAASKLEPVRVKIQATSVKIRPPRSSN